MPSKTIDKDIAEKERGRLHTSSLDEIRICCMKPLLWRVRDRSVVLLTDISDSEYVSPRESSIFDSGVD
jgi:hypothetical protein